MNKDGAKTPPEFPSANQSDAKLSEENDANGFDESYTPETDPRQWWNFEKHWKYRKGKAFYLLCRVGFGLPFRVAKYETSEAQPFLITEDDKSIYDEIARSNPDAITTLFDASPDTKKMVQSKLISTCHFLSESIEAFFDEAKAHRDNADSKF